MIVENYVYLILSENRLVILRQKNDDPNYYHLLNNNGHVSQQNMLEAICKTFCIGYILGSERSKKCVNNIYEFQ